MTKTGQIPGPCQKAEEIMEHESDSDTTYNWSIWNSSKDPRKET